MYSQIVKKFEQKTKANKKLDVVKDTDIIKKKEALLQLVKKIRKCTREELIEIGKKAFKLRKESFKGNYNMMELDLLKLNAEELEELAND